MQLTIHRRPPAVEPPPTVATDIKVAVQRAAEVTKTTIVVHPVDLGLVRAAMSEGVVVTLNLRWWRKTAQLDARDDGRGGNVKVSTGKRKRQRQRQLKPQIVTLLPEVVADQYTAAESRCRRSLKTHGFPVDGYGHFVPLKNWSAFEADFASGKVAFEAATEAFCAGMDRHLASTRAFFDGLVSRAWMGHRAEWSELGRATVGFAADHAEPTQLFREWFVNRFVGKIPTPEIVRGCLVVDFSTTVLHVPEVTAGVRQAMDRLNLQERVGPLLERQRDDLPQRFIEAVRRVVLKSVQTGLESTRSGVGSDPVATRTLNSLSERARGLRALNLTSDPDIEAVAAWLIEELRKAEARADAQQRQPTVLEVFGPLRVAFDRLAALSTDDGEE